jgi:cobalt-precorrin 5A hydrolase
MDTVPQTSKPIVGRIAVWALTANGRRLGDILCRHVPDAHLFISNRLEQQAMNGTISEAADPAPLQKSPVVDPEVTPDRPDTRRNGHPGRWKENFRVFGRLSDAVAARFHQYDCHVFIFSTGIAVRIIAPLLSSKLTDPAVVVLDDQARHAVSLVSGHIGHGNRYACQIGHLLGATPVITTATDVNALPSIDLVADRQNLYIETPDVIKTINMAFLENRKIGLHDPLNRVAPLIPDHWTADCRNTPQVFCDWRTTPVSRETLVLRPRVLAVGVGCNRHTPVEAIMEFYTAVLTDAGISRHSVFTLATSDIKKDEPGILALAEYLDLPIRFYDNPRLSSVETIQTPSQTVEKHIGVKSVCEAAAILASHNGTLILPKQKNADVTLAIALQETGSMS